MTPDPAPSLGFPQSPPQPASPKGLQRMPQARSPQARPAPAAHLPTVWLASCFMRLNCFFMAAAAPRPPAGLPLPALRCLLPARGPAAQPRLPECDATSDPARKPGWPSGESSTPGVLCGTTPLPGRGLADLALPLDAVGMGEAVSQSWRRTAELRRTASCRPPNGKRRGACRRVVAAVAGGWASRPLWRPPLAISCPLPAWTRRMRRSGARARTHPSANGNGWGVGAAGPGVGPARQRGDGLPGAGCVRAAGSGRKRDRGTLRAVVWAGGYWLRGPTVGSAAVSSRPWPAFILEPVCKVPSAIIRVADN